MKKSVTMAALGILAISAGILKAQSYPGTSCNLNAGMICGDTGGNCMWMGTGQKCANGSGSLAFNAVKVSGYSPGKCQGSSSIGCSESDWGCTTTYYDSNTTPPAALTCDSTTYRCTWVRTNHGCQPI